MITKMKKLQCLVYHRDYDTFLQQLRELGVVHVTTHAVEGAEAEDINAKVKRREQISTVMAELEKHLQKEAPAAATAQDADALLTQYKTLTDTLADCKTKAGRLTTDIETLKPWGEFDPALLAKIQEAGHTVNFYECAKKLYNPEWTEPLVVSEEKGRVRFITVTPNDADLLLSCATQVTLPAERLSVLQQRLAECEGQRLQTQEQLHALAVNGIADLRQAIADLQQTIDFARVCHGTERAAEGTLAVLEGWIPAKKADEALGVISQKAYCQLSDPTPDDEIPILLSNDGFSRMFEPIMKLYMMPKYSELDLTPFFAPFYMLFFGLCLGDTGYGLFILLAAIAARFKIKNPGMRGYINLVITLGISAVFCGLLSGSFFGFNMYEDGWPMMDRAGQYIHVDNSNMFNLAIILGVVQILFGMVLKVVNRWIQFGWQYAVGSIGWILILVGSGLTLVLPETPDAVVYSLVGVGVAGAALYNSPEKYTNPVVGLLVNIGLFLWDAYNTATGLLGDLLSYVRLFALGLSGGILATVFNSLAAGFASGSEVIGPLVWVFIFLFGHGLNIFMSALGAMVHPLRLTFVEFFKNAGFEGGSVEYAPFKNNE